MKDEDSLWLEDSRLHPWNVNGWNLKLITQLKKESHLQSHHLWGSIFLLKGVWIYSLSVRKSSAHFWRKRFNSFKIGEGFGSSIKSF